jgi:hypothetical protein
MNKAFGAVPEDPFVADVVALLEPTLREWFEERAGIMEFEGRLPWTHAECLALVGVLQACPSAFGEFVAVEIQVEGHRRWTLASEIEAGRLPQGVRVVPVLEALLGLLQCMERASGE